jgi:hypothetical protein
MVSGEQAIVNTGDVKSETLNGYDVRDTIQQDRYE